MGFHSPLSLNGPPFCQSSITHYFFFMLLFSGGLYFTGRVHALHTEGPMRCSWYLLACLGKTPTPNPWTATTSPYRALVLLEENLLLQNLARLQGFKDADFVIAQILCSRRCQPPSHLASKQDSSFPFLLILCISGGFIIRVSS